MGIIQSDNVSYHYIRRDEDDNIEDINIALNNVSLDVEEGQFICILGHNGSGKSTFAKHINALLTPTEGTLYVDGIDTSEDDKVMDVRGRAGMIFQNPDNQIIASIVEEDVGFGPENIGVPTDEIWERVIRSLKTVGMWQYRDKSPNKLSGGQKQRVAIAGVMAMEPKCIVADEPTAMLDPVGRQEVIEALHELNKKKGVTVILITHYMEEVVDADKVYVMHEGKIELEGTPREVFSHVEELKKLSLDVPQVTLLAHELKKEGLDIPDGILARRELVEALKVDTTLSTFEYSMKKGSNIAAGEVDSVPVPVSTLILDKVSYVYSPGNAYEKTALDNVSLRIKDNEFLGIIGHTGSGKSTLIQHMNGLLMPTSGKVYFNGKDTSEKGFDKKELRSKVGMVFQYPEHQLFEATVFEDICYGPSNLGLSKEEIDDRVYEALRLVEFPQDLISASPFDLSGGQKRRAAIAGVLAMKPEILVLDEPTAGLDPKGRDDILDMIVNMHKTTGNTVILVSHSMEDIARLVDRIIVMNDGRIKYDDTPKEVFKEYKELEKMGLKAPQITYLMNDMRNAGMDVSTDVTTVQEAKEEILRLYGNKG